MTKEIRITVTAPEDCTEEQFQEWIEYCTGNRGGISMENPLWDCEMEAETVDIY